MNILIIGNSSIAQRRILPALERLPKIKEVSIATSNSGNRSKPKNSKLINFFDNYETALAQCNAELVYISTVNSSHEYIADKALNLGYHVIVDKPAFLTLETTQRLVEKASRKNILLTEATVFLDHPVFSKVSKILETLGPVTRAICVFSMPPFSNDNFRYKASLGGGALNDLGPYAVATSRFFMQHQPRSLNCSILQSHPNTGVDISFALAAEYDDGKSLIGNFGFDTEYKNSIQAIGPKISLSIERGYTPPVNSNNQILIKSNNKPSIVNIAPADSFELAIMHRVNAIEYKNLEPYYLALLSDAQMLEMMRKSALENI
jgi:predicted dehydrogenase